MDDRFRGIWQLEAYAYMDAEVPFEGDTPTEGALEDWLYAKTDAGFPNLKPLTGLQLTLRKDGSYSETQTDAALRALWFDSEGVQVEAPIPTTGKALEVAGRSDVFLYPSDSPAGITRSRNNDRETLRYDDGDTLVCDLLRIDQQALLRVISVVTDEIYLSRVVAKYKRLQ